MMRLAAGVSAMVMAAGAALAMEGPAKCVVVRLDESTTPVAQWMRNDLAAHWPCVFSNPVAFSTNAHDFDIAIGTPENNEAIANAVRMTVIALPAGPNADQGYTLKTVDNRIYVASSTEIGALYGMYALLEAYGAYFQISGQRMPEPTAFNIKPLDVCVAPVFQYRGLLPWDNFLCGMSGYNLEDYKDLLARAARMKLNMLQFHFYPGLVYFTETVDGETAMPQFVGAPVDVFRTKGAAGEAVFNGLEQFAPRPYVEHLGDPRAQAEACQAMLREVIDFAHGLGFKTCVGFELMYSPVGDPPQTDKPAPGMNTVNPLDPRSVEVSLQRYRSLVETYPNSDFYWLWQSEGRGFLSREVGREPGAAEMREQHARWAGNRELTGDIDYAYLFREVVNRLTPEERARLATGGWTIDHIFPGLHPDLPPEPVFASLNVYHPRMALDNMPYYRVAQTGRPTWMIEWWEFDGEQWFPQFRAGWQERMYDQCLEDGVDSVTLLGWKLSAVEHNVRYLADYAWNPGLSAEQFYRDYVARLYGPEAAPLARVYLDYDAIAPDTPCATPADDRTMLLGAGWMALALPPIPGSVAGIEDPAWKRAVERAPQIAAEQRKLQDMDRKAIAAFDDALPKLDATGRHWAGLMRNRLEFRIQYIDAMQAVNEAFPLYDRVAREEGIAAAAKAAVEPLQRAVDLSRAAIETYAQDVRNRGDQGLVAQLNAQVYRTLESYLNSLGGTVSPYLSLDPDAIRLVPTKAFDFTGPSPFAHRDGIAEATTAVVDGQPILRLSLGGNDTVYNSVWIHQGDLDLAQSPILDLTLRTRSAETFAILFQIGDDPTWHALNLVGRQQLYPHLDGLPRGFFDDGRWHRVFWDLHRLVTERLGVTQPVIRNVILGAWDKPAAPIVVEIRDFAFGKRRTLD